MFKLVILGDSGVGKTSVMQRFLNKKGAKTAFRPTIGWDFHNYKTQIGTKNVTLQIWDTAGQERFQSLGKAFYRGSDAWILVYDITNEETLTSLTQWIETFSINAGINKESFPFLLVGNKSDLEESRQVTESKLMKWWERNGISKEKTYETSAETGQNVDDLFQDWWSQLIGEPNKKITDGLKELGDNSTKLDKKALVKRKPQKSGCW